MYQDYIVPSCSGIKIDVKQGETITVIDSEGGQVVDFFAEAADHSDEFLSTGVTIDCNESLKLKIGDIIYTNLYNPMMKVLFDNVGEHDLLHPCCRREMYDFSNDAVLMVLASELYDENDYIRDYSEFIKYKSH